MVLALKIPLINQMTGNQYLHVKLFEGGIEKKIIWGILLNPENVK